MTDLALLCVRCGEIHEACKAHSRANRPCKRPTVPGTTVCYYHGGNAPHVRAAGLERLKAEQIATTIAQELAAVGRPLVEEHPIDGLLKEVWRSASAVEVYGQLVAALEVPGDFNDLVEVIGMDDNGEETWRGRIDTLLGLNHNGELAANVLVRLWNEERERHAKFCKLALDAGVAERLVRMAEVQGQQIVGLIMAVLDDKELNLTPEQKAVARQRAAKELRGLPSGR